ncbi:uncharacterized protein A4U43_C01F33640 [Asparagus officinalis]|uniref:Secreted protein n=1 Tax=Asparagus officinalis TaxID=4686 RepID=A0A5P1FVQ3_ASPOF|nr:uncharacterized protein A4U43_C01F33640 [Asparagus officinalis]
MVVLELGHRKVCLLVGLLMTAFEIRAMGSGAVDVCSSWWTKPWAMRCSCERGVPGMKLRRTWRRGDRWCTLFRAQAAVADRVFSDLQIYVREMAGRSTAGSIGGFWSTKEEVVKGNSRGCRRGDLGVGRLDRGGWERGLVEENNGRGEADGRGEGGRQRTTKGRGRSKRSKLGVEASLR